MPETKKYFLCNLRENSIKVLPNLHYTYQRSHVNNLQNCQYVESRDRLTIIALYIPEKSYHDCFAYQKHFLYLKNDTFKNIQAGIKIWGKNISRIFQAQFGEKVKNTQAQRNFHHSYKKKACMRTFVADCLTD